MKLLITVEGRQYEVEVQILDESHAQRAPGHGPGHETAAEHAPPPHPTAPAPAPPPAPGEQGSREVKSPAAGSVVHVNVSVGDAVAPNDPLVVIEAMKMESSIVSPVGGTVRQVLVKPGDAVAADQVLVRL